ncbi:transcriptional regulator [Archaeoglobales archaeon]|nr:MAG: transcriptional regulator [Archaeoglobales archaeon]
MPTKEQILNLLSKSKTIELMYALKEPKKWDELREIVKDPKTLSKRLNELYNLNLVTATVVFDKPKGSKAHVLTDFGRFVLQKLEEIEKYSE